MCLPYCNIFNTGDFAIRKTYWPVLGPLLVEITLSTPYPGLSQGTFQTNKHNHFNEIKDRVSRNDNWNQKKYKNFGILQQGRHIDSSWAAKWG